MVICKTGNKETVENFRYHFVYSYTDRTAARCARKSDGLYVVPDVFMYLECKNGSGKFAQCPDDQYFVANEKKCRKTNQGDYGR